MPLSFARTATLVAVVASRLSAQASSPAPDHIYMNGRIWTGDDRQPTAEALAVRGDRIVAVGSNSTIRQLALRSTVVVDLRGRRVVPGFNDAHWHFPARRSADLTNSANVGEIQRRLKAFARTIPPDAWIMGRGWSPSDFPDNQAHRKYLDAIFPDRPALIIDRDGHQTLANSRAISLAGVTRATPDPENGRIVHDSSGEPTGLFKEAASQLVRRFLPATTAGEAYATLLREMQKAAAFGLTSLQVAGSGGLTGAEFEAFRRAFDAGALKVRLRVAVPFSLAVGDSELAAFTALRDRYRGQMLSFGIAKGMLDGTVDAHTAAMLEPYVGGGSGLPMWSQPDLDRAVARYDSAGLQVELHAIGDRAIRMALDAYEESAKTNPASAGRHRVEHVEVPSLEDLPRFKALGVIASTQAIFASPDATTLQNYAPAIGSRAAHSNAFKLFDDAGAVQAFGSDYPVFPMDVMLGIYTAVTRQMPDGTPKGGWYPEHRISVEAALRHFTRDAAYASFDETNKGTLAVGKVADFTVLSNDILRAPPAKLLSTKVMLTVMGGRVTHRAPPF